MPGPFLPRGIADAAKKRLADVGRSIPLPDIPNPFEGIGDRLTGGRGFTPSGVFEASGIPSAVHNAAATYNRAQQGTLGFFTGDNPFESVQQAVRGVRGQEEFSPQDLGFARQMPKGSTQRRVIGDVLGRIVDPFTLATLGSGAGVRAAETGADIAGPLFRESARRAGLGEVGQAVADITGSLGGGLAGAGVLTKPLQQAERAAERQIAVGIQPGMSIQRVNPDDEIESAAKAAARKFAAWSNAEGKIRKSGKADLEISRGRGAQFGKVDEAIYEAARQNKPGLAAASESAKVGRLRTTLGEIDPISPEEWDAIDTDLTRKIAAKEGRGSPDALVLSRAVRKGKAVQEWQANGRIGPTPEGLYESEREVLAEYGYGDLVNGVDDAVGSFGGGRKPPKARPTAFSGGGGKATPPSESPAARQAGRLAKSRDAELAQQEAEAARSLAQQRSRYPTPPPGGPQGTGKIVPSSQPPNVVRIAEEARKRAAGPVVEPKRKATAFDHVLDFLNIPRTVKSSFDLSAPFRQGGVLSARNPKEFWGAWEPMVKSFGSEGVAKAVDREIRSGKMGIIRGRTKLYMAPLDDAALSTREEAFASRLATHVPGIEHSQRAYVTFLNKLRADVFDKNYERLVQSGLKGEELTKAQDELASFINWATGRGDIKGPELVSALTNVFFSPKLLVSRFQTIRAALPKNLGGSIQNDVVRQIARENVATWMGQNMAVLGLLSAAGAATGGELVSVELDPRSSDWGKLRVGNTRIDPWAGFQQIGRSVAQIASGDVKTSTGSIMDKNRLQSVGDFARSKANPALGIGIDQLLGQTAIGEDVETGMERLKNLLGGFAPLSPQDIYQGMVEDGLLGAGMGALGTVGFGVSSYSNPGEKVAEKPYGEFSGKEQLDVHRAYAWQTMGEQPFFKAEIAGSGTYSDWRKKKVEEVKAQLSGMSPAAATATAEKAVDEHPVSQAYTELRNQLEDQWGLDNPEEALKLLDRESKKPEQERTFRPTKKVRDALEEYRRVKQ